MAGKKRVGGRQDKTVRTVADGQAADITLVESREMNWLADNNSYAEEHLLGQWVAISGDQLVAHGHDLGKVAEDAKKAGYDKPLLTRIRRRDPDVFQAPSFRRVE